MSQSAAGAAARSATETWRAFQREYDESARIIMFSFYTIGPGAYVRLAYERTASQRVLSSETVRTWAWWEEWEEAEEVRVQAQPASQESKERQVGWG